MNERILQLRKHLNLTQDVFGKQISLTRSAIANIENGNRSITDRVILDICREFNVNETWLRTGEGEMFQEMNPEDELAFLMGKIIGSDNQFIKDTMLALAKLDEKDWDFIKKLMDKIKNDK